MIEPTNQLFFEILKSIQAALAEVKATQAEHTRQLIRVREDINNLRGDDLRREAAQAHIDLPLERIERRLELTDA